MKFKLKEIFINFRNRWGPSNIIRISKKSKLSNFGNLLQTSISIKGNSSVMIGKNCIIRNANISVRGNNNIILLEDDIYFSGKIELFGDGNSIKIGRNTRINGADFIVHNGTTVDIGPNCLFSTQIDVRTTDSHYIYNSNGQRINHDKNIVIGEHVWIGRLVSILKGSSIGNGAVIGSMSLVSGSIPTAVIAVGVPAIPIKVDVSWAE